MNSKYTFYLLTIKKENIKINLADSFEKQYQHQNPYFFWYHTRQIHKSSSNLITWNSRGTNIIVLLMFCEVDVLKISFKKQATFLRCVGCIPFIRWNSLRWQVFPFLTEGEQQRVAGGGTDGDSTWHEGLLQLLAYKLMDQLTLSLLSFIASLKANHMFMSIHYR